MEKFFIFIIFAARHKKLRVMKKILEKLLPLFDFIDYANLKQLKILRKFFTELLDEVKEKHLTFNSNSSKSFLL